MANAGGDVEATPGDRVTLSGTNSRHLDGGTLAFHWIQVGGPCAMESGNSTERPEVRVPAVPPEGAVLTFRLVVESDGSFSNPDETDVFVAW